MKSFNEYMSLYRKLMAEGELPTAYRKLLEYISGMRNHFANKYPSDYLCGPIHQGQMDITFFTFTPEALKRKNLKIAIVFSHADVCFEAWLVGINKQVQATWWKGLKDRHWSRHPLPVWPQDYVTKTLLVETPNFDYTDALTQEIETRVLSFISDITEVFTSNKTEES